MHNLELSQKRFVNFALQVVDLNHIFRDVQHHDELMIKNQKQYIQEEVKETINKGLKERNPQEFVDGVADVFVTAIFLEFLLSDSREQFIESMIKQIQSPVEITVFNLVEQLEKINDINKKGEIVSILYGLFDFVNGYSPDTNTLIKISDYNHSIDGELDIMTVVQTEVNESNLSKFPLVESFLNEDEINNEIKFIKQNKNLERVHYVIKNGRVTFLNSENNKFQKPQSFKEPNLSFAKELDELKKMINRISIGN